MASRPSHPPRRPAATLVSKNCRGPRSDEASVFTEPTPLEKPSFAATWGYPTDTNLLSPPLSVQSMDIPPFRALESDHVSLSMKRYRKRKSKKRRAKQAHNTSMDLDEPVVARPPEGQLRSGMSLPDLRQDIRLPGYPTAAGGLHIRQELRALHLAQRQTSEAHDSQTDRRASVRYKPRRWTVSNKAPPTRGLSDSPPARITTNILTGKNSATISPRGSSSNLPLLPNPSVQLPSQTPAMITLQRASSKGNRASIVRRLSLRPNAITSFPPPKFHRTTSTYFASFFRLPSRNNTGPIDPIETRVRQSSWNSGQGCHSSSRGASIDKDRVQITLNTLADPAFTQVDFQPRLSQTHLDPKEMSTSTVKRYSSTIVAGASIHEIIWDENITSSSEGSAKPHRSRSSSSCLGAEGQQAVQTRRRSVLVQNLQAQLKRSDDRGDAARSSSLRKKRRSSPSKSHRETTTLRRLSTWAIGKTPEVKYYQRPSNAVNIVASNLDHTSPDANNHLLDSLDGSPKAHEPSTFFPPLSHSSGNASQRPSVSFSVSASRAGIFDKVPGTGNMDTFGPFDDPNDLDPKMSGPSGRERRKSLDAGPAEARWAKKAKSGLPHASATKIGSSRRVRRRDRARRRRERSSASNPDAEPCWNREDDSRRAFGASVWKWLSYDGGSGSYIVDGGLGEAAAQPGGTLAPLGPGPIKSTRGLNVLHLIGEIENRAASTIKLNTVPVQMSPVGQYGDSGRTMSVDALGGIERGGRPWLVRFGPIDAGSVRAGR